MLGFSKRLAVRLTNGHANILMFCRVQKAKKTPSKIPETWKATFCCCSKRYHIFLPCIYIRYLYSLPLCSIIHSFLLLVRCQTILCFFLFLIIKGLIVILDSQFNFWRCKEPYNRLILCKLFSLYWADGS